MIRCRDNNGYAMGQDNKREHTHVAERALGKRLPKRAVVHHINEIRHDNRPENLVICQDSAYHLLLHRRQRALRATGNPNAVKCRYCLRWVAPTDPDLLDYSTRRHRSKFWHRTCQSVYTKGYRAALKRTHANRRKA